MSNPIKNPVLILIPVVAALILFFVFRPKKKEGPAVNVVPDPSEPVMQYPIAFEPAPVAEVGGGDPVEVQPEETVPAKPKKAAVKKKTPIKK